MGRVLSLDLFSIVGIRILLLGIQLFDGRHWRPFSSPPLVHNVIHEDGGALIHNGREDE